MSTENIAHEKRYRDWWAQYNAMFAPENRSPQQDEQFRDWRAQHINAV